MNWDGRPLRAMPQQISGTHTNYKQTFPTSLQQTCAIRTSPDTVEFFCRSLSIVRGELINKLSYQSRFKPLTASSIYHTCRTLTLLGLAVGLVSLPIATLFQGAPSLLLSVPVLRTDQSAVAWLLRRATIRFCLMLLETAELLSVI